MPGNARSIKHHARWQMTPGALPPYGHPLVKIPHLAEIAAEGLVFENASCNFPLCVPPRMSMLAGRCSSAIVQWDNAIGLPASVLTPSNSKVENNSQTRVNRCRAPNHSGMKG